MAQNNRGMGRSMAGLLCIGAAVGGFVAGTYVEGIKMAKLKAELAATTVAATVARSQVRGLRSQNCVLKNTVRDQRRIVSRTVNPVVTGMRAVQPRKILGTFAGWIPIVGDAIDTVITGAVVIEDRRHARELKGLNKKLDEAAVLAKKGCNGRS